MLIDKLHTDDSLEIFPGVWLELLIGQGQDVMVPLREVEGRRRRRVGSHFCLERNIVV